MKISSFLTLLLTVIFGVAKGQEWIDISPSFDPPGNYTLKGTFKNAMEGWMAPVGQLPQRLYYTTDGGLTWVALIEEDSTFYSNFIFVDNSHGWIKVSREVSSDNPPSYEYYLWRTRDGGNTWEYVSSPPDSAFYALTFIDSLTGYSGGENAIYRTIDGGESWQSGTIESDASFGITDIYFVDEEYGWAVGISSNYLDAGIILKTIDGGETWQINLHPSGIIGNAVYFTNWMHGYVVGSNVFWEGVIMVTNDGGANWQNLYLPGSWLNDVVFTDDSTGWAVGDYGFIWYTENGGETWEQVESGTNADLERVIFVDNGDIGYIFGKNNTLLKYDASINIIGKDSIIPSVFKLYQNYPNPFNPKTIITYELKRSVFVSLRVYDLTGKEVITFVDEQQKAGSYQVVWDGRDQYGKKAISGIYFCQLKANSFRQTQKMILVH